MEDKKRCNACLCLKFDDVWLQVNIQMTKKSKRSRIISTDYKNKGNFFSEQKRAGIRALLNI